MKIIYIIWLPALKITLDTVHQWKNMGENMKY